jgi:hypothetical protein
MGAINEEKYIEKKTYRPCGIGELFVRWSPRGKSRKPSMWLSGDSWVLHS